MTRSINLLASSRAPRLYALLSLWIVCAGPTAFGSFLSELPSPCAEPNSQKQWDDGKSPVYQDATELGRMLSQRGFAVECIRRSKLENTFTGQKGAAWYQTKRGVFEVLFLPNAETFDKLEVVELAQANGRYAYKFRGSPPPADPAGVDSSKRIFFIKHGGQLFWVWGDERLAASLSQAFQHP